jgi:regulator of sirC expression with transglutaminase-like and TPR domain
MHEPAFDDFLRSGREELDLETGALLVARDAYPGLVVRDEIARLDRLASGLAAHGLSEMGPEDASRTIATHLYERHGFRGNEEAYGDPRNSYLNDVVTRKLGIPITLGILVLGVARRLGVPAHGVSFPGHFLVRFERPRGGPLVIDPFYRGRALSVDDLGRLLKRAAGASAKLQVKHLEPATPRQILVRVLQNLKAAHVARGDLSRALVAAARVVTLMPRESWALRDRAVLQAQLGATEGARSDLERYLELTPDASDAAAVRQMLGRLSLRRSVLQ